MRKSVIQISYKMKNELICKLILSFEASAGAAAWYKFCFIILDREIKVSNVI